MTLRERVPQSVRPRLARTGRAGRVLLGGAGLAWIVLLSLPFALPAGHVHPGSAVGNAWSIPWAGGWVLMIAAMMWPLLVPTVDRVARSAYPAWRIPLTSATVVLFTVLWLALGLAAGTAAQLASVPAGSVWWQLGFLLFAAGALRLTRRTRLLARCGKLPPVAPRGLRGVKSAARAGVVTWRRCAALCGPAMIAMVVGHNPVVLVAVSCSVWWEARHPRAWRDPVPLLLLGVAGLGAVGGALLTP
jgi:Predicted metal-binding integral membrane protein (DUF2182)